MKGKQRSSLVIDQMKKRTSLFSVVIVTYVQNHLLETSIDSVIKQDYENIELIICDNGSCDFDEKTVKTYIEKHRRDNIKRVVVRKQTKTVSKAENYQSALELTHGEYVGFLTGKLQLADADTLTKMGKLFTSESSNLIVTRMIGVTPEGNYTDRIFPVSAKIKGMQSATPEELFELIGTHPYGTYIRMGAAFWKRKYLLSIGGFSTEYSESADWYLWLKICELGHRIDCTELVTIKYLYDTRANDVDYVRLGLNNAKYQERIMLLEQIVRPKLKGKLAKLRLDYLIQSINARIVKERNWFYMSLGEKTIWRIRNIKLLLLSKLYKVRNVHRAIDFYQISRIMAIISICMLLKVPLFGIKNPEKFWAVLVVITGICIIIKICQHFGAILLREVFEWKNRWRKR